MRQATRARADHRGGIAIRAGCMAALALATACGTSSYPTPTAECKADSDCVIDDVPRDCCGHMCGPQPPWVAIDTRSREAIQDARRARCEGKQLDCPAPTCPAPPDCRARPRAVCQGGRCVARVELADACGKGDCEAACGAQPAASPPGLEGRCAATLENAWVRCCCHAVGTPAAVCDQSRATEPIPDECRSSPGNR